MTQARLLYGSENGDRWFLVHAADPERVFVRHEPNAASGGRASEIAVGDFLSRGGDGPEKQALARLLGTLVEEPAEPAESAASPVEFV